ncbi:serine hydrolase [Abyssisolibacter fermentans]|uniref:serine hydrolase n=1 Tax=Abyssisolibacter fermentans TaxID=1766203 RepID=UPI00082DCEDE|nr:serine hydrolase [Abyssisolibacter fermentans]
MYKKTIALTIVLCLLLTGSAFSIENNVEKDENKEVLNTLFNCDYSNIQDLLDTSFLEEVSVDELVNIIEAYKNNLGEFQDVISFEDGYKLLFKKGYAPAKVLLSNENKIMGIWFGNCTMNADSLEAVLSQFKTISGDLSICIKKNYDELLVGVNHDTRMAVGSTFKLYVLKALYEAVENKKATWDDVVKIKDENKSLPSGMLQEWNEDTPVTIKTLANLMISISDNTATDHLIDYIRKSRIEKYVTKENKPFLKTSEAFRIKYGADAKTQERYINGSLYEKRKVINNIKKKVSLDDLQIQASPTLIKELEWFFTTEELCDVIYDLKDSDEIKINPGLVLKENWNTVGFKGGSEPGVLNYTQLLQKNQEGDIYTISVTVNNTENNVDVNQVTRLTQRLISLIENGKLVKNME